MRKAIALAAALLLLPACAATPTESAMPAEPADAAEREIRELHAFFQAWFRADLPRTDAAFDRFRDALAPGFEIVTPDGTTHDREAILALVWDGHAADAEARVWIENPALHFNEGAVLVASYDELQQVSGGSSARRSTVVFRADEAAPNGLRWLRVHETALPEQPGR